MGQDTAIAAQTTVVLPPGHALPNWRKSVILFIVSMMTLAATFSSTCLFPAEPAIAAAFGTTSERINVVNAGVLVVMGSSSLIWAPIAAVSICGFPRYVLERLEIRCADIGGFCF